MEKSLDSTLFVEERKRRIVSYINENSRVTVAQLSEIFNVSPVTIRKYLNDLHEAGFIRRTHGGAIANIQVNYDPAVEIKSTQFLNEKKAIAKEALKYVREGACIALDAGTTVFELAVLLKDFKNLTVITYDLDTAHYLALNTDVRRFIAGGEVRKEHHYVKGHIAESCITGVNIDTYFVTTNGLGIGKGITTPEMDTANIKRILMKNSNEHILLTDSSKIDNISFAKFAEFEDIDVLVTDEYADSKFVEYLKKIGIVVEKAVVNNDDRKKDESSGALCSG